MKTLGAIRSCEECPMPSTKSSSMRVSASPSFVHPIVLCWLVGTASLTLGGCVSTQTYESAQQEAKTRATELAQAQADIQGLEQQRDAAHAANQRDERALASLKNELHSIQASFDQIRKDNQARLADLQHRIAVLRARHQLMLKEISETKRYEKQLETLTAQRERAMAPISAGLDGRVTTVDGHESEPRMVAVITPRSPQADALLSSPAPVPSAPETPAAATASPSTAAPQTASTASPAAVPVNNPVKPAPMKSAAAPSTANMPAASHNDSWFSTMTEWLASMFDWIWS
jgi:hypothetical protein